MNRIRYVLFSLLVAVMISVKCSQAGQTNVTLWTYATIESSANAYVDIDEITLGDLRVKSRTDVSANATRKSYLAFDLTGKSPNTNINAVVSLRRLSSSGDQHIQLWALNQAFSNMGSNLVWGNNPILIPAGALSAQANNTTNNDLFTNGTFTATALGDQVVKGGNATDDFTIPAPWGKYVFNNKIVFVVSGIPDTNSPSSSAGYRIAFTGTNPPPLLKFTDTIGNQPPSISSGTNMTIYSHEPVSPILFTISDDVTATSNLNLKATSSDTAVVGGFTYTNFTDAGHRALSFIARSAGSANITVTVDDGSATNFTEFTVTVLANPTITTPTAAITYGVTPVMSQFTVGDVLYPLSSITNWAVSGYSNLVADSGIIFGGGLGSNRTVTVQAQLGREGVAIINLYAANTNGSTPASYPMMILTNANCYFADHFDYPDGLLRSESAYWWTNRVVGSVSLRTIGGRAKIRPSTSGESLVAPLAGGPYSSGVIYYGFNVMWTNLAALGTTNNGYFASLYDPVNALQVARVYTKTNDVDPSLFDLSIACQGAPVAAVTNLALNTNYRVVVGYDIVGGTFSPDFNTSARMWVNQTTTNGAYVQANDSASFATISYVQLRQNTGTGDALVDDLKVGASFESVLPAIPAAQSPAFNPPAGDYATAQTVTIGTSTLGASIRYTLDGSIPSATVGTVYSSPITISNNTTLRAVAYAAGMTDSAGAVAVYSIGSVAPTAPVITRVGVVTNTLQIDFTGAATDLSADFKLLHTGSIPATFTTNTSAIIIPLAAGSFRAIVDPIPAGSRFYRIQH